MPPVDTTRRWALRIIWVALLAISLPILTDAVVHIAANSWAGYVVVVLPLAVIATIRAPTGRAHGLWAVLGVAVGVGIEVWAIASGTLRIGRFGLVVAAVAVLLLQGRADRRNVPLLALCVPIPSFLLRGVCEPIVAVLCRVGAAVSNALGAPAFARGMQVEWSSGVHRFEASDLGASAALLGLAIGWFLAADRSRPLGATLQTVVATMAIGWLAHALVTLVLFLAARPEALGSVRPLRDVIAYGATLAVVLAGRHWLAPDAAHALRGLPGRAPRVPV